MATWQYCNATQRVGAVVQTVSGKLRDFPGATSSPRCVLPQTSPRRWQPAAWEGHRYRYWLAFPYPPRCLQSWRTAAGYVISSAEDLRSILLPTSRGTLPRRASSLTEGDRRTASARRPALGATDLFYAWAGTLRHQRRADGAGMSARPPTSMRICCWCRKPLWGRLLRQQQPLLGQSRRWIATGHHSRLVGRAPPVAAPFYDTIVFYFFSLGGRCPPVVGIIRTAARLRRWRAQPERRPLRVLRVGWHVVVPLVLNLIPAFLFLVVSRRNCLAFHYQHDIGP